MIMKVIIAVAIMVIVSSGIYVGRVQKENIENKNIKTCVVMLDNKIVEYYLSHSNTLPIAENGCVSKKDLQLMGLDGYELYSNPSIFSYVVNLDGTYSLKAVVDGNVYESKNSNKVLKKAEKELF